VDKDKTEAELSVNIKKATSAEETAPSESYPWRLKLTQFRAEARQKWVAGITIKLMNRVHRLHLGLPFFPFCMERFENSANPCG
jgi:hypothetical protein